MKITPKQMELIKKIYEGYDDSITLSKSLGLAKASCYSNVNRLKDKGILTVNSVETPQVYILTTLGIDAIKYETGLKKKVRVDMSVDLFPILGNGGSALKRANELRAKCKI